MCIDHSVGSKGINKHADVKIIQILLNLNIYRLIPMARSVEDGKIGPKTIGLIEEFQRRILPTATPSGRVDPGSPTLKLLRQGAPKNLTAELLHAIMPGAGNNLIQRYFQALNTGMLANQINTPLRMAHFLAQVGHESGDLIYSEEIASGEAYEGRADLGNTEPGDGKRFKGRGLIQLTGRTNYTAYGKHKGRDFIAPTNYLLIATDPQLAVDVSSWFWATNGLNAVSDTDDVKAVTKIVNGGYNGLADREQRLARAKCFLLA